MHNMKKRKVRRRVVCISVVAVVAGLGFVVHSLRVVQRSLVVRCAQRGRYGTLQSPKPAQTNKQNKYGRRKRYNGRQLWSAAVVFVFSLSSFLSLSFLFLSPLSLSVSLLFHIPH